MRTETSGRTARLKTLPCLATQVSVHPPLSQMRMGAVALMMRDGVIAIVTALYTVSMRFAVRLEGGSHDRDADGE